MLFKFSHRDLGTKLIGYAFKIFNTLTVGVLTKKGIFSTKVRRTVVEPFTNVQSKPFGPALAIPCYRQCFFLVAEIEKRFVKTLLFTTNFLLELFPLLSIRIR